MPSLLGVKVGQHSNRRAYCHDIGMEDMQARLDETWDMLLACDDNGTAPPEHALQACIPAKEGILHPTRDGCVVIARAEQLDGIENASRGRAFRASGACKNLQRDTVIETEDTSKSVPDRRCMKVAGDQRV